MLKSDFSQQQIKNNPHSCYKLLIFLKVTEQIVPLWELFVNDVYKAVGCSRVFGL